MISSFLHSTWWDKIALWGLGAVLSIFIFSVILFSILRNYKLIEGNILQGISAYASELYDLYDRMFQRKPIEKIYSLILIPTGIGFTFGFILGMRLGLFSALLGAAVLGFVGYRMPGTFIRMKFQKRIEKFDKQLVDALNMMANAIKSGLSFLQVVQVIEREMPSPCRDEFGMVLKENRVGIPLNDALLNMSKRMPSEDLFMIVNSVVTLAQQGGDLSDAFDTIATTIRERQRVHEKVRTLAQAGITQGVILSGLPFVMLGVQYVIQPNYVMLLFTTPLGWAMFTLMIVMMVLGALWMKTLLTIDV